MPTACCSASVDYLASSMLVGGLILVDKMDDS